MGITRGVTNRPGVSLLLVVAASVAVAAAANHVLAVSIGIGRGADYRRIGPVSGPQVLCIGSSVLRYSLAWPDVSAVLGQGIEHTNVAGSTPEIWEVFQRQALNTDTTIVGLSPYDLNEYRIGTGHAFVVPLSQTVHDLRESGASWGFSRRVLSEYPMAYARVLFPTAGESNKVLVGVRRLIRQALKLSSSSEDAARVLALPKEPLLDFGGDEGKLSDLARDRVLRRLSLLRAENRGMHAFHGPKQLALRRIMDRASQLGRVILVVLPVSSDYRREFLPPHAAEQFDQAVADALARVPDAVVVRLDRVPELRSDDYFTDFVHMNSAGRAIATKVFTEAIQPHHAEATAR